MTSPRHLHTHSFTTRLSLKIRERPQSGSLREIKWVVLEIERKRETMALCKKKEFIFLRFESSKNGTNTKMGE